MMKPYILLLFLFLLLLGSCNTPKDVSYFQGIESLSPEQLSKMNRTYNPKICTDDRLVINVTSPDRETASPYNPPAVGYYKPPLTSGETPALQTDNQYTYLVDKEGYINFPELGRIPVAGLTIDEANRMLEEKIKPSVPKVLVDVRIINFKVSIMGEVNESNSFEITGNRVSILDLIAMAGNLTINADRKNILLVRDNNGQKEFIRIDLTRPEIFASPYYYLQQNDVVYVEPNDAQKKLSAYTAETTYKPTLITGIFSAVALVTSTILQLIIVNREK
jgi:polysaccharide export outer membrane protein